MEREFLQRTLAESIQKHTSRQKENCKLIRLIYDSNIYSGSTIPRRCERCLLHLATREDRQYDWWKYTLELMLLDPCNRDIRALFQKRGGYTVLLQMAAALFSTSISKPIVQRLALSFLEKGYTFDVVLTDLYKLSPQPFQKIRPFVDFVDVSGVLTEWDIWIKEQKGSRPPLPYLSEIIEVGWDPSRVVDWCLDWEEQMSVRTHFQERQSDPFHDDRAHIAQESHSDQRCEADTESREAHLDSASTPDQPRADPAPEEQALPLPDRRSSGPCTIS
jgi:hypothetical protein